MAETDIKEADQGLPTITPDAKECKKTCGECGYACEPKVWDPKNNRVWGCTFNGTDITPLAAGCQYWITIIDKINDEFSEEPTKEKAAWVNAGRPRCMMCGHPLYDINSIQRGIGPECCKKYVEGYRSKRAKHIKAASWVMDSEEDIIKQYRLTIPKRSKTYAKAIFDKLSKGQQLSKKQRKEADLQAQAYMIYRLEKMQNEDSEAFLEWINRNTIMDEFNIRGSGDNVEVEEFVIGWG